MISLSTIAAVFLILIGVNVCIYIGKKAYRTHVLLKDTLSYILLQYGIGVLVVYLIYLELMSCFGIDARPSITRELILWSALTLITASLSYFVSKLAVTPSDGILFHIHNVLVHRLMDGTKPEAWRATMHQFEIELSKATKYQTYGHLLPKCLQRKTASEEKMDDMQKKSSCEMRGSTSRVSVNSDSSFQLHGDVLGKVDSRTALLTTLSNKTYEYISIMWSVCVPMIETAVTQGVTAMTTALKYWWIRLSGIRITLGSVDDYYKEVDADKRARIPSRRVPPLTESRNQLNLEQYNSNITNISDLGIE